MRTEARIFIGLTVFFWVAAAVYAIWSKAHFNHIENAGFAALVLTGGLSFIIGSFFWFVSRRIDPRPEDRPDAEIAEGAGELGFFSPGSYWPIGIAGMATLTGVGFAFVQMWLVIVGVALILFTVGGLLFEYYTGGRHIP